MSFTLDCYAHTERLLKDTLKVILQFPASNKQVRSLHQGQRRNRMKKFVWIHLQRLVGFRLGEKVSQRSETESDFCQNHTRHKDLEIYSLKCRETKLNGFAGEKGENKNILIAPCWWVAGQRVNPASL